MTVKKNWTFFYAHPLGHNCEFSLNGIYQILPKKNPISYGKSYTINKAYNRFTGMKPKIVIS